MVRDAPVGARAGTGFGHRAGRESARCTPGAAASPRQWPSQVVQPSRTPPPCTARGTSRAFDLLDRSAGGLVVDHHGGVHTSPGFTRFTGGLAPATRLAAA